MGRSDVRAGMTSDEEEWRQRSGRRGDPGRCYGKVMCLVGMAAANAALLRLACLSGPEEIPDFIIRSRGG